MQGLVQRPSNKLIAKEYDISPRTVEVYRANVMTKMQASNLSELVGWRSGPALIERLSQINSGAWKRGYPACHESTYHTTLAVPRCAHRPSEIADLRRR